MVEIQEPASALPVKQGDMTTSQSISRPLYGRQRLRVKTGCLTCRARRKKCSERRPLCHSCSKLSLQCDWPKAPKGNPEKHSHQIRKADAPERSDLLPALKPILPAGPKSLQYRPTADEDDHVLFEHFRSKFSYLILPTLARGFRHKLVGLIAELRKERCLADVLYAVSAVNLATTAQRFENRATEYYVSAISRLRGIVERKEIEGSEDWLICVILLFPLFEAWRPATTSNLSIHVQGAYEVLRFRIAKISEDPRQEVRPLDRTLAEAVLYNTSIVSLYVDIDTQMVEDIFQAANGIIQSTPFPGSSNLANSPVMMAGPRLFLTIFKLSQLCRRAPLWPEDRSEVDEVDEVDEVARELHAAIISLEGVLGPDADDTAREELLAPKLYALAASIMLYKLQNPAASASDPEVQVKVRKAMEILPALPSPFAPSQYLCWPIYIVGCAVVSWPDKVFILWMLQTLSVCGDLKRAAIALQANWNAAEGEPSGLDMLLHKRSTLYQ